jgi:hypothetical protein
MWEWLSQLPAHTDTNSTTVAMQPIDAVRLPCGPWPWLLASGDLIPDCSPALGKLTFVCFPLGAWRCFPPHLENPHQEKHPA